MGFLESLRDKELRGLYRARKLIENADLQLAQGHVPAAKAELGRAMEVMSREGLKDSPRSKEFADALVVMSGIFIKAQCPQDPLSAAEKAR